MGTDNKLTLNDPEWPPWPKVQFTNEKLIKK